MRILEIFSEAFSVGKIGLGTGNIMLRAGASFKFVGFMKSIVYLRD
jgi:hypothetical protein